MVPVFTSESTFRGRLGANNNKRDIGSLAHSIVSWVAGDTKRVRDAARAFAERNLDLAHSLLNNPLKTAEEAEQTKLVRDIFGNPFRPVAFSPEWRTDTAIALAHTMYDQREFSTMPILADALQDAGCDNQDILTHCRSEGTHVRGCWVVDLVLGKE